MAISKKAAGRGKTGTASRATRVASAKARGVDAKYMTPNKKGAAAKMAKKASGAKGARGGGGAKSGG